MTLSKLNIVSQRIAGMLKRRRRFVSSRQSSPVLPPNIWEADLFRVFPCCLPQSTDMQLIPTCATPAFRHPRAASSPRPHSRQTDRDVRFHPLSSAYDDFVVLLCSMVLSQIYSFICFFAVSCPVSAAGRFWD